MTETTNNDWTPEARNAVINYLTAVTTAQIDLTEHIEVWLEVLTRTNPATARLAIKEFAVTSTEYPRPAHVGRIIARIHAERLADNIPLYPPLASSAPVVDAEGYVVPDDFDLTYQRWEAEWRRLVSLGCPIPIADQRALAHVGQRLEIDQERKHAIPALPAPRSIESSVIERSH